jgi:heme/copper-type cytochrome/quinol oxidase subunit 2
MFIYAGVTFSGAMFMLSFTFYNEEGFMFYVVLFVLLGIVVLLLVIGMLTYRVYFYHNKMVIRRFGIFMKEYSLNMIKKDVTTVASGRALYAFKFKYRIEEKGSKE